MADHVEEIKQRLDLVELLNEYLKLEKAGINYKARCPFHNEKTPSFFVSAERQTWKCFGCGLGGDHFTFIEQIEGVEFKEALQLLARRAGVTIRYSKKNAQITDAKSRLRLLHNEATKFYEYALVKSKGGALALTYLKSRGMKKTTMHDWNIGYAPSAWRSLCTHLVKKGFTVEELLASGFAIRSTRQPPAGALPVYDRFRARIMFPIADVTGQVVGFTGRILPEAEDPEKPVGKYVNSPQTPLFDKSRIIFGLNKARLSIRQQKQTLLVEGQMDVVMSHQAGITNAVAVSGTAMTPQHLNLLKRYSDKLVMAFDRDDAGEAAAKKSIFMALDANISVEALMIPKGSDPADIIAKEPATWEKIVGNALPIMDYFFAQAFENHDARTIAGKKAISSYLFEPVAQIANKIEQHAWLQTLAQKLAAREEDIVAEFEKFQKHQRPHYQSSDNAQLKPHTPDRSPRQVNEENVVAIAIGHPVLIAQQRKSLMRIQLQDSSLQDILNALLQMKKASTVTSKQVGDYLGKLNKQFHIRANELALRADIFFSDKATAAEELQRLIDHIEVLDRRAQIQSLQEQLHIAEQSGDDKQRSTIEKKIAALFA